MQIAANVCIQNSSLNFQTVSDAGCSFGHWKPPLVAGKWANALWWCALAKSGTRKKWVPKAFWCFNVLEVSWSVLLSHLGYCIILLWDQKSRDVFLGQWFLKLRHEQGLGCVCCRAEWLSEFQMLLKRCSYVPTNFPHKTPCRHRTSSGLPTSLAPSRPHDVLWMWRSEVPEELWGAGSYHFNETTFYWLLESLRLNTDMCFSDL